MKLTTQCFVYFQITCISLGRCPSSIFHWRVWLRSFRAYWLKYRVMYYISTVKTQHMQRPDVLLQLGYTWRHVSAVKQPFSGKVRIILLRYSKIFIQWDPIVYIKTWQQFLLYLNNTIISWPEDGPLTAETCHQV